jgi:hypothetical protein
MILRVNNVCIQTTSAEKLPVAQQAYCACLLHMLACIVCSVSVPVVIFAILTIIYNYNVPCKFGFGIVAN